MRPIREGVTSELNCPECGKKILDENSSFCAYCGVPFDSENKSSDFLIAAGILALVAAAFSIAVAATGINNYLTYAAYYAQYDYDTSFILGFLLFGVFALVSSIFGFAAGLLSLAGKRFKLAVLGTVLLVASSAFILVVVWLYEYGFGEYVLLSAISPLALSLISTFFMVKSKFAFSEYATATESFDEQPETSDNAPIRDEGLDNPS